MIKTYIHCLFLLTIAFANSYAQKAASDSVFTDINSSAGVELIVLGTVQDAGSPQIGCKKSCCAELFGNTEINRKVVSLGVIDHENQKTYLFDASPDLSKQLKMLTSSEKKNPKEMADGIFLTHAHIGHYSGLMYLGKEAMDAEKVPVFVMPRMKKFLTNNGPWSLLVERNNIELNEMNHEETVQLSENIKVTPFLVPHRDEYSETVGYRIEGPSKKVLYIPDIDKWEKWNTSIIEEIKSVEHAFLDATFYGRKELNNRDISQIPHPFVIESMEKFKALSEEDKRKIIFIHFNHTNPLLEENSEERKAVNSNGFRIAFQKEIFQL